MTNHEVEPSINPLHTAMEARRAELNNSRRDGGGTWSSALKAPLNRIIEVNGVPVNHFVFEMTRIGFLRNAGAVIDVDIHPLGEDGIYGVHIQRGPNFSSALVVEAETHAIKACMALPASKRLTFVPSPPLDTPGIPG